MLSGSKIVKKRFPIRTIARGDEKTIQVQVVSEEVVCTHINFKPQISTCGRNKDTRLFLPANGTHFAPEDILLDPPHMGGDEHLTHKEVPKKDNTSPFMVKGAALSKEINPSFLKRGHLRVSVVAPFSTAPVCRVV
jgi:hypothetical protein